MPGASHMTLQCLSLHISGVSLTNIILRMHKGHDQLMDAKFHDHVAIVFACLLRGLSWTGWSKCKTWP